MPGFEQQPPPLFKQGPAPLALLILYVCSSISLLILDDRFRYLEPLRSVVTTAVSPLKKIVQWPVIALTTVDEYAVTLDQVRQENTALRQARLVDAEKTQHGVAGERQWLVNDLGAKHDLLRGGLCWGHMPHHVVAEDLANGTLVELQRRAWHMRPLTFMISQRRGYSFSESETRLVDLLGNCHRFSKSASKRSVSRKGKKA